MASNIPYVSPANLRLFRQLHNQEINEGYPTRSETTEEIAAQIKAQAINDFVYKGETPTFADLPDADNKVGDVYTISETMNKYFWNGEGWLTLGSGGSGSGGNTWTEIVDKPDQFPPEPHTHSFEDLSGVAAEGHSHEVFGVSTAGFVPSSEGSPEGSFLGSDGTWSNPETIGTEVIDYIWGSTEPSIPDIGEYVELTPGEIDEMFEEGQQ